MDRFLRIFVVSAAILATSVVFCGVTWLVWTMVLGLELLIAPLAAAAFLGGIIGTSVGQWLADRLDG